MPARRAQWPAEMSRRRSALWIRCCAHWLARCPSKIPAASQGTMNNLTFGGSDARPGRAGGVFAYYETIAGGMGARPDRDGVSGIHTHMTNSLNTPIEVLEHSLPLRVRRYELRRGSGGAGKFRGGDGIVREFQLLGEIHVGMLSDRRKFAPYGLSGGAAGKPGRAEVEADGVKRRLESKGDWLLPAGTVLRVESPGGGGWGKPNKRRVKRGRRPAS